MLDRLEFVEWEKQIERIVNRRVEKDNNLNIGYDSLLPLLGNGSYQILHNCSSMLHSID